MADVNQVIAEPASVAVTVLGAAPCSKPPAARAGA
jgi:hypothetical protein